MRLSKATMFSFPSRPVVASRCAMRAFLGVFNALRSSGEVGSEHPSIVVVVRPLLSLMKDQVSMLFSVLED